VVHARQWERAEHNKRGASALVGNTDLGCRVSCFKQKDAAKFDAFSLKFQNVQYGPDQAEASVVLVRDDANTQPALRQSEAVMLAALTNAEGPLTYTEWKEVGIEVGLSKSTVERTIRDLQNAHLVEKSGKRYSPVIKIEQEKEDGEEDHLAAD